MPPTSLSTPPTPGEHIESYELLESIGLGGNATVFKASCPTHGVVAVKVLHPGKLTELDIKRFRREFQAMKALQHPNIIEVYKIGMHGSYPWMSMELVNGGDLSDKIAVWNKDTSRRNTFVEIVHTFGQLCLALEHLHNKGMIHRDLKPSNILLTAHNKVKLTDFGGVKAPHSFKTDLTMLGSLIGTVAFMAPEQILGEPVDQRTDLYALGAVLYMSLTGVKPFVAKTMAEYLAKHLNQAPPSAQDLRPEAPAHLVQLCTRLMQKDPTQRLQHAKAVYTALHNQSSLQLLGAEKVVSNVKAWIQSHHTSLVLLYGHQGMGTKTYFKHIIEHHRKMGWDIHLGYNIPPVSKQKKMLVISGSLDKISSSFFSELLPRVLNNEPLTILVNTVDKWKMFGQHLTIPKKAFALEPLSAHQIQQLLQPFGLSREGLNIISSRLHTLYKGRIEYIQESLRNQWVYSLRTMSTEQLRRTQIPSSQTCLRHQEHLLNSVYKPVMPVLTALLVFDGPISTSNLYKLMDASSDRISPLVQWLNDHQWIEIHETGTDRLIQLHPFRFGQFLYRLLPADQCIIWHQKVGEFLQQKSRLQPADRKQILHHLSFLGDSLETNTQRIALAKWSHRKGDLSALVHYVEGLNDEWMEKDTKTMMTQMLIDAYIQTGQRLKAIDKIKLLLANPSISSDLQTELKLQLFVLTNRPDVIDHDDDSVDRLLDLSSEKPLFREATLLRGIQRLYYHNITAAKHLFSSLINSDHRDSIHEQASIGLSFTQAAERTDCPFSEDIQNLPNYSSMPWYLWYLEFLLTSGQWTLLTEYLTEQRAFERYGLTEEIFEVWTDYLQGNAPRAKERLEHMNYDVLSEATPSTIRLQLHIIRLQKRLRLPELSPLIRWSVVSKNIESHREQWSSLQQGLLNLEDVPWFWHRDLMILDAAMLSPSAEEMDKLWTAISDGAWGIKIQVAKIFSDDDSSTKWQDIHGQTIRECARHMAGDIHIWH